MAKPLSPHETYLAPLAKLALKHPQIEAEVIWDSPEGWQPWPPPLKPEYEKAWNKSVADAAAGKRIDDPVRWCLPPGMPRYITNSLGMTFALVPGGPEPNRYGFSKSMRVTVVLSVGAIRNLTSKNERGRIARPEGRAPALGPFR